MSTSSNYTIIPPTADLWAVIDAGMYDEKPFLLPVIAWALDFPETGFPILAPESGARPAMTDGDFIEGVGEIQFVGPRERAEEALEDAMTDYTQTREWAKHGDTTVERIAAWASEQTEPWTGFEAWDAVRPPLSADDYGWRVIARLLASGRIERVGTSTPSAYRAKASAAIEDARQP